MEQQLLPVRMVNEFVYCPRLFWLEYVEREFEHSYDTVDGLRVHKRVDEQRGELPNFDELRCEAQATSVELSSEILGVVGKIDVVRIEDGRAIPVDFKRGRVPAVAEGAYEPERIQVALQALLLRENGYQCDEARIYYATSKTYVNIEIDAELAESARRAAQEAEELVKRTTIPPPLVDSPKCGRCSLNAICLPDEISALRAADLRRKVRPFAAPSDDRVPVYVMQPGSRVGVSGEVLQIGDDSGVVAEARLLEVAHVSLFGNVQISSQAARALLARDVPFFYLSYGGWISGYARSVDDHSLDLRVAQHAIAKDSARCLSLSKSFVLGKVQNQRTMVRRALGEAARPTLQAMSALCDRIEKTRDIGALLGFEGMAAKHYFEALSDMLGVATGFEVHGRTRRPPTDPVNALLSFGYSMLVRELVAATIAVGFEPSLGVYHQTRAGRPSLALDLMEEFRPLIVDSTVLRLINTREIAATHFDRRGRAIVLTSPGRRIVIEAIERRLRSQITHPTFGYSVTYRRALHVQARLLARAMQEDIPAYPAFTTR